MFAQMNDAVYLVHPSQSQKWWAQKSAEKTRWGQNPTEAWDTEWGSSTSISKTHYTNYYPYYQQQQAFQAPTSIAAVASAPHRGATMQPCNTDSERECKDRASKTTESKSATRQHQESKNQSKSKSVAVAKDSTEFKAEKQRWPSLSEAATGKQEEASAPEDACQPCGDLPSIGSAGHADGSCKRCAFFPKGRCLNGFNCDHCHFEHPKRGRRRRQRRDDCEMYDDDEEAEPQDVDFAMFVGTLPDAPKSETCEFSSKSNDEFHAVDILESTEASEQDETEEAIDLTDSSLQGQDEVVHSPNPDELSNKSENEQKCGLLDAARKIKELEAALEAARAEYEVQVSKDDAPHSVAINKDLEDEQIAKQVNDNSEDDASTVESKSGRSRTASFESEETHEHAPSEEIESTQESVECLVAENKKTSVEKFAPSANSWAAQARLRRQAREASASRELQPEEVGRKVRSLLNKLTEERFESICSQVMSLPTSTPEHLSAVVAEIFDKATTEQGFLNLYTELCLRIDAKVASESESLGGGKPFRRAVVTECQAYFERTFHEPTKEEAKDLSDDEIFEQHMKLKTRCLGNMRFIGKLLVEKLLAGKILIPIVTDMLDVGSDASLEALAVLLSVVGPHFEEKPLFAAHLKETFSKLRKACVDPSLPLRIRCLLCDLLEERARGWVPKKLAQAQK